MDFSKQIKVGTRVRIVAIDESDKALGLEIGMTGIINHYEDRFDDAPRVLIDNYNYMNPLGYPLGIYQVEEINE